MLVNWPFQRNEKYAIKVELECELINRNLDSSSLFEYLISKNILFFRIRFGIPFKKSQSTKRRYAITISLQNSRQITIEKLKFI